MEIDWFQRLHVVAKTSKVKNNRVQKWQNLIWDYYCLYYTIIEYVLTSKQNQAGLERFWTKNSNISWTSLFRSSCLRILVAPLVSKGSKSYGQAPTLVKLIKQYLRLLYWPSVLSWNWAREKGFHFNIKWNYSKFRASAPKPHMVQGLYTHITLLSLEMFLNASKLHQKGRLQLLN